MWNILQSFIFFDLRRYLHEHILLKVERRIKKIFFFMLICFTCCCEVFLVTFLNSSEKKWLTNIILYISKCFSIMRFDIWDIDIDTILQWLVAFTLYECSKYLLPRPFFSAEVLKYYKTGKTQRKIFINK